MIREIGIEFDFKDGIKLIPEKAKQNSCLGCWFWGNKKVQCGLVENTEILGDCTGRIFKAVEDKNDFKN